MEKEKEESIINLIRLANKAGAVTLGKKAVERSIFKHKARLIFSSRKNNLPAIGRKKMEICNRENIQISCIFSDEILSNIFGRRTLTVVSIDNLDFARGIKQILDN